MVEQNAVKYPAFNRSGYCLAKKRINKFSATIFIRGFPCIFFFTTSIFLQQPTFMYHFRQNRELQFLLQLSASQLLFFFHLPRSSRGSTDGLAFNIIFRLPITIPYKDGACIHLSERKYCLRKKLNKPVFLSLECPCFLE